jgi:hypothetical protein
MLTPRAIADEMQRSIDFLVLADRNMAPRHRSKQRSARVGPDGRDARHVATRVEGERVRAEEFFAREFARTADRFGLLARFLDGRFLEMLLKLHFTENAFALELFLQGTECLFDVIVADADLHVVVTTFLS